MDDPNPMRSSERVCNLNQEQQGPLLGQTPIALKNVGKLDPPNKVHGDIEALVWKLPEVHEGTDIRMLNLAGFSNHMAKAALDSLGPRQRRAQDLDRKATRQDRMNRSVNHPKTPAPDALGDRERLVDLDRVLAPLLGFRRLSGRGRRLSIRHSPFSPSSGSPVPPLRTTTGSKVSRGITVTDPLRIINFVISQS